MENNIEQSLSEKKCIPCEGNTPPLVPSEAQRFSKKVDEWTLDETFIEKTIVFKDFAQAMAFINRVAAIAEAEQHHPDINLHDYNKVTFKLSTHAIGGLSENDFILAAKIDEIER